MYSFSRSVSIAYDKQVSFTVPGSKGTRRQQTFLISGIFGVKRCEICEITSWMRG
jgi:hypothetical protein